MIADLLDRQRAAPGVPELRGLEKQLGPLFQKALFAGKFVGDGYYLLLFLHPDGRLLNYNLFFDEINEFTGEGERYWALRIGSLRYPELAAWIPPRPAEGAETCPDCGGSGLASQGGTACADCDGRGWREVDVPPAEVVSDGGPGTKPGTAPKTGRVVGFHDV